MSAELLSILSNIIVHKSSLPGITQLIEEDPRNKPLLVSAYATKVNYFDKTLFSIVFIQYFTMSEEHFSVETSIP